MNVIAIQQLRVDVPRPGRPRRRLPAQGPQRPRRRRARLHERRRPAPAHPARRSGSTASSPTAGDKPNIVPGPRRRRSGTCGPATLRRLEPLKERVLACLQAGADAAGCTMDARVAGPGLRRHARQRAAGRPLRRQRRRGSGAPSGRARRPALGVVGSTDMGNVSYVVPEHPPDDQGVARPRLDPHARSSPATPRAARATGRCSTGPRRWP